MIPFQFGSPGRRLFGIYHPHDQRAGLASAVLLCNPFGQEAVRVHRFFRVLAQRLSRGAVDVLRFDAFGTGDSMGDDEDGDIDGWCLDLRNAHMELVRRSGAARVTWLGARLGARLALRACRPLDNPAQRLLLWDPVLDGAAYLETLRLKHVEALEKSYGPFGPDWRRRLAEDADAFAGEALGFALSPLLRRQLDALDFESATPPPGVDIHVIGNPTDTLLQAWLRGSRERGRPVQFAPLVHNFDWTAEEALNTALVPAEPLQRFMSMLAD
jgi:hypothetical protein